MFSFYNDYLNSEFSSDYWSDEGISQAVSFVNDFDQNDWVLLNDCMDNRTSLWLVRCAETLGDKPDVNSLNALLLLIQVKDSDVQLASVDSINALLNMGLNVSGGIGLIEPVLDRLKSSSGKIAKIVIDDVLRKLSAGHA